MAPSVPAPTGGKVNKTKEDLEKLQELLDRSDANAGRHLREVITPGRRLEAGGRSTRPHG